MARESVFDLLKKGYNIPSVCKSLLVRFKKKSNVRFDCSSFDLNPVFDTCEHFFNSNLLRCKWKGFAVCFDDMLGLSSIYDYSVFSTDDCVTVLELLVNCYSFIESSQCRNYPVSFDTVSYKNDYQLDKTLCNTMIDYLHMQKLPPNKDGFIELVDVSPAEVLAAESLSDDDKKLQLLRYHHRSLQGDLTQKQAILKILSDEFESRKPKLSDSCPSLVDHLGFALNSCGIRHNNMEGKSKHTFWVELTNKEKEEVYDETFEMIVDSINMTKYVEKIKPNIDQLKKILKENKE